MISIMLIPHVIFCLLAVIAARSSVIDTDSGSVTDILEKIPEPDDSQKLNKMLNSEVKPSWKEAAVCRSQACIDRASMMLLAMNSSVDPCENFYNYACGSWLTVNPIPANEPRWGVLLRLQQNVNDKLKELLEFNIAETSTARQKVRRMYSACMNEAAIETVGINAFRASLDELLGGWPLFTANWNSSTFDFAHTFVNLARDGVDLFIDIGVTVNQIKADEYIVVLDETTLGLPSKKMYDRPSSENVRKAYLAYMKNMTLLYAEDNNITAPKDMEEQIRQLFDLEVQIAKISYTEEERRDPKKTFNQMLLCDLNANFLNNSFPNGSLITTLKRVPLNNSVAERIQPGLMVNVMNPNYFSKLDTLLPGLLADPTGAGKRLLANYFGMRYMLRAASAIALPKKYQDAAFEFNKVLSGVTERLPRWKECITSSRNAMVLAMGSLYVRSEPGMAESKHKLKLLIKDVKDSFVDILETIDWMDDETKTRARQKIASMEEYTGYPDFLLDNSDTLDVFYDKYNITDSHFENCRTIGAQSYRVNQENLLKKRLRNIDEIASPSTVNAGYYPNRNLLGILAGVMQPPIYHKNYPAYLNLASLGQIIGHELTHGFDDKGSEYDENGALTNWWTNTSRQAYRKRAQTIIDQYSKFVTPVGAVNGQLTAGENIADNGGVKQAYNAMKRYLKQVNGHQPERLPGFELVPFEKMFFLSSAQTWCGFQRPEYLASRMLSDPHSPYAFRVNGPLSNMKAFADTYGCLVGSPMNPVQKAGVW